MPKAPARSKATTIAAKSAKAVPTPKKARREPIDTRTDPLPGSIIASTYRQGYAELRAEGGSGQGCNDAIDRFMRAQFMQRIGGRYRLNVDAMVKFAIENDAWSDKWEHVNNGQKRMNVANALRRILIKGQTLKVNPTRNTQSRHVGDPGGKYRFDVTVTAFIEHAKSGHVYVMEDDDHNVVVYRGRVVLHDSKGHPAKTGSRLSFAATVKEHSTRDGVNQTLIAAPSQ